MSTRFSNPRFPRASAYHPDWLVAAVGGAANPLWMTEWLCESLDLKPGMRILDLGCGRAASSIFMHREYGVHVFAVDLWFSVTEIAQRISDAGCAANVFPLHADARSLPFAGEFFDAIVSIDSFPYYGTDDHYLQYLARFVKPSGLIAIAGAGLTTELNGEQPPHFRGWWTPDMWCLHSAAWWRQHWDRTGLVDIELSDTLPDGWRLWRDWLKEIAPENTTEIATIEADAGRYLGYVRTVARRRADVRIEEPITSIPMQYEKKSLLRPK